MSGTIMALPRSRLALARLRGGISPIDRSPLSTTILCSRKYATSPIPRWRHWPKPARASSGAPPLSQPRLFSTAKQAFKKGMIPKFAFAFDIDGVLLRSSAPVPGASKTLSYLQDHNIPFILLTNGGGSHESARVKELSSKLGVPLTIENFVQSHTPFQRLVNGSDSVEALKDKTILVTGGDGDNVRKVAETYGFKNVVIPGDILKAHPNIWPFNQVFTDYYDRIAKPLPRPIDPSDLSKCLKIDAIFVFNDPRDWALDSQIILDLLLSKEGYLGTYSAKNGDANLPNHGWLQDNQPPLFFSNPDLFWATSYHMSRLGQGGFQACIEGIWNTVTSGQAPLAKTVIGKPHRLTYAFAEEVLDAHRQQILSKAFVQLRNEGDEKDAAEVEKQIEDEKLERVYMVGDNPESDIRGANDFESPKGVDWTSVLVKTGVYRDGETPKYKPKMVVENVKEAVRSALEKEGWDARELE